MPEANDFGILPQNIQDPRAGFRTEYGDGPKLSIQEGFERRSSKANEFNIDEPTTLANQKILKKAG